MRVDSCGTEKIGQWEMLPDTCLLHIFKYLSDDERSKAALVCHHWHNIMRMPCLWRCRSFHFSGRRSLKPPEYVAAKGYAENLGVFLESLEVTVSPPRSMVVAQRLHSTICALLNALVSCPDLKVILTVEQVIDSQQLVRILLPEIPIMVYNMTAFYSPDENWNAKPLLRNMLPCYRHSLQVRVLRKSHYIMQRGLTVVEKLSENRRLCE
ncbi:hypothetical protein XENOCAPTIV_002735 [Xenoophorus captivus]|uniref:F-box domain-containing protein n=1 Tax=Xenoophorus captivus TaxID=1517983 RepID=A0ABV0S3R9_9TELE